MNDKTSWPCLHKIDAECFKAKPAWAKQAFAYKLAHLLFPPELTKRLPTTLRQALIAPGVLIPPGVELPPGIVVAPGTEFPPGWTIGDPWPPGIIEPAELPPDVQRSGPTPPLFTEPFAPGPAHPPSPSPPVEEEAFFYDDFDVLDPLVWTTIYEGVGGTITIQDGQLRLNTFPVGSVYMRHFVVEPWPDKFDVTFKHKHVSGDVGMYGTMYTGVYAVRYELAPPNTFTLKGPVIEYVTVDSFDDIQRNFKLVTNGAFVDLYQNDVLKYEGFEWGLNDSFPGRITLGLTSGGETLSDDLTVIDQSG